jgi:hypothetical protein
VIPKFQGDGNLPPDIHTATWIEVTSRYTTNPRREHLMRGLLEALRSLKNAGCKTVYLDGSFVTAKELPGDFDACWEITGVDAALLDSELLDFSDGRARQKARYSGELFPAEGAAEPAGTRFLDYFQHDRHTGIPKGIIPINLGSIP